MLSVSSHRYSWKGCSRALGSSVWMFCVSIKPLWGSGCAKLPLQLQPGLLQVLLAPQLAVLSYPLLYGMFPGGLTGIFRTTFLAPSSSDSSLCATPASRLEATGEAGCWGMAQQLEGSSICTYFFAACHGRTCSAFTEERLLWVGSLLLPFLLI